MPFATITAAPAADLVAPAGVGGAVGAGVAVGSGV